MKVKLEFEFELPQEIEEFDVYSHAMTNSIIIDNILNIIRDKIKYDDNITDEQYDILQKIFEDINIMIDEERYNR